MLIIDSNEPDSIKFGLPIELGIDATITPLDAGDIMLVEEGNVMLIERKAAADLLNSITNGRLIDQASRMIGMCRFPLVLSHGSLYPNKEGKVVCEGRTTRHSWFSLQMALISLQAGGIWYLHVPNNNLISKTITYLQNWLRKDIHLTVARRDAIPFLKPHEGVQILASLPGIGMQKANDCYKYYGKAGYAIAELTHEDGTWPKGVGKGIVKKVRDALGFDENEWLEMVHELEE